MKKNAFTLIELLAVIVILAIIALIATPIILGIINDTKMEANKRSVEMYSEAVENAIIKYQMQENRLPSTKEEIKEYITLDKDNIDCEIKINKDGSIYVYKCVKDRKDIPYEYGKLPTYNDGEIVYFDVESGVGCTEQDYHVSNSNTGYNGYTNKDPSNNETLKLETQNSCLKFYAFNDDESDKINLLLDHNTTAKVAWHSGLDNSKGPSIEPGYILDSLKNDTKDWSNKIITPNNYYEYDSKYKQYIINYDNYKARLITAHEIDKITGADKALNGKNIVYYYVDGAKGNDDKWQEQVVGIDKERKISEFYWLFDRTSGCIEKGCKISDSSNSGYWTSTAANGSNVAWVITSDGSVGTTFINYAIYKGIRPVIEVLKSSL